MLPPLATVAALIDRLARTLTAAEETRAAALLSDVSAEVRTTTGRTWTRPDGELDPARPDVLAAVTLRAAERAMRNPDGLSGETLGEYTRRWSDAAGAGRTSPTPNAGCSPPRPAAPGRSSPSPPSATPDPAPSCGKPRWTVGIRSRGR